MGAKLPKGGSTGARPAVSYNAEIEAITDDTQLVSAPTPDLVPFDAGSFGMVRFALMYLGLVTPAYENNGAHGELFLDGDPLSDLSGSVPDLSSTGIGLAVATLEEAESDPSIRWDARASDPGAPYIAGMSLNDDPRRDGRGYWLPSDYNPWIPLVCGPGPHELEIKYISTPASDLLISERRLIVEPFG